MRIFYVKNNLTEKHLQQFY